MTPVLVSPAVVCRIQAQRATLRDLSLPLYLGRLAGDQLNPHHLRLWKESLHFPWCDFLKSLSYLN